ncbi:hypothetical protein FP515_16025 [Geobacillus thermoleovorans]|uniref:DUF1648 domain-containing protein n=1 Tax=Geobacillus thermoleovorans TaxID=33941 RepID=A0A2Z3N7K0_GEOTH|nr:hypothetical protein GC56T3_0516 [Geobacillus sp. C56-T3]ADU95453.1 hypothetical protein GYMC52_3092 [Geobacillus sp. Y412MC52]ASS86994.1 hypothetical protein GLN3_07700 [Geobacillus lituanicus]AWO74867.1 hypothetical protein C1N76_10335 [Geobacillus thermoleovorans]EPR26232.1 hypothetical protein I656_04141 [Geobacillus sp. WSUCF1]EQB96604.1 hypothetical protein GA8_05470 [Geobacillus sp. A8]KDE46937.1 hypothetical protein DI44_15740 [Geobacillus sp. CAMR5420]QHN50332.1 hypothetical prot
MKLIFSGKSGIFIKVLLLVISWFIILFSLMIQNSDAFIYWFNPSVVSISDERYFYTLVPTFFNILLLFFQIKFLGVRERKTTIYKILFVTLVINTILFLYYAIYQFFG